MNTIMRKLQGVFTRDRRRHVGLMNQATTEQAVVAQFIGRQSLMVVVAQFIGRLLLALCLALLLVPAPLAYAADSGVEFEAVDDMVVSGTEGTKDDADLEVKGVSSFAGDVFVEAGVLATPYGGLGRYENLLTYSDAFDNAVWVKTNVTAPTADQISAPDGATTAEALAPATAATTTVKITSGTTAAASTAYTFSVWLKTASGTKDIVLTVGDSATNSTATASLTTSWQRFSVTYTSSASPTGNVFGQIGDATWTADTIHAWGGQLEQASTPGVYAKAGSSVIAASRGVVSTGDIIMPSLKLSGGTITDTTGAVTVGSDLRVTGDGPHYISSGNVGIGTTAPGANLVIRKDPSDWWDASTILLENDTWPTYYGSLSSSAGKLEALHFADGNYAGLDARGGTGSSSGLYFIADSTTHMFMGYDGDVGIGYAYWQVIPGTGKLQVNGNVGIGLNDPIARLDIKGTGTSTNLTFHAQDSNGSSTVAILDNGNVGIGTTGPTQKLQVVDTLNASNRAAYFDSPQSTTTFGNSFGAFYTVNSNQTNNNYARFDMGDGDNPASAAIGAQLIDHANNYANLGFWTRGTSGWSEKLWIESNGNVGIGVTNPTSKLHVSGNIAITGTVDGKDIATNAAMLNEAETISANWVNTANPWADNEVVDALTISSSGSVDAAAINSGTVSTDRYTAYGDLSAEGYLGDNAATDLTSKSYVDNAIAGLKWKSSVKATTTANGTLATAFANTQVIDGVTLATGDRILIKDQTTGSENGIYTVNASGAPTRATDADSEAELVAGAVFVEQGTSFGDVAFVCSNNAITLETTSLTFVQFTGAQAYTWGDGLTNSGTTISVGVDNSTIEINADQLRVKDSGITSAKISDGTIANADLASGSFSNITGVGTLGSLTVSGATNLATTSGNVGIGTTSPNALLHIGTANPGTQSNTVIIDMGVDGTGTLKFHTNGYAFVRSPASEDLELGTRYQDNIYIYTNDTKIASFDTTGIFSVNKIRDYSGGDLVLQDDGGSVGIGTTAPAGKLHIAGTADDQQLIVQANSTQAANLQEWQNSSGTVIGSVDSDADLLFRKTSSNTSLAFDVYGLNGSSQDFKAVTMDMGVTGGFAGGARVKHDIKFAGTSVFNISESGTSTAAVGTTIAANSRGSGSLSLKLNASSAQLTSSPLLQLIDNSSAKVISGDHLGNLYMLGNLNTPNGGIGEYANLLTYSEQFDNSAWVNTGSTVVADALVSPNGLTTAESIDFGSSTANNLTQTSSSVAASKTYTASIYVRHFTDSGSAPVFGLEIMDNTESESASTTISLPSTATTWQRVVVTKTFTGSASGNVKVRIRMTSHASGNFWGVYAWGVQLEEASSPGPYVTTTASTVSSSQGLALNNALRFSNSATSIVTGTDEDFVVTPGGTGNILFTSGNVGIGDTAPAQKLEVAGNIALTGTVDGYDISAKGANWDTAYTDRLKWDGGATGLNASTGRTSLELGSLATKSTVASTDITDGTIVSADISDATIAAADIATGAIIKSKLNELRPREQGTPNNTAYVEAGIVSVANNARVTFAGGNSPTFPVVSANSRIDLLTLDSAGTLGRTAGTEAATPSAPTYPSDKLIIAEVTIDETVTVLVNTADITDVRPFLNLGGGTSTATDDAYVNADGDTMTGTLTLPADGLTAGTNQLVLASGNVGIGTTAPVAKLDVNGDIHLDGTGNGWYFKDDDDARLRIGSTSTGSKAQFELYHSVNPVSLGVGYSGGAALAYIESVHSSYATNTDLLFKPGGTENWRIGAGGSSATYASSFFIKPSYDTYDFHIDNSSSTPLFYLDTSSGNVGIGTTAPVSLLQLDNQGTFTLAKGLTFGDGNTGFHEGADNRLRSVVENIHTFTFESGSFDTANSGGASVRNEQASLTNPVFVPNRAGNYNAGLGGTSSDDLSLITSGVSRIYINPTGEVGIATTAPEADLDVAGTLRVATAGDTKVAHDLVMENITSSAINSYGPLTIQSGTSNDNFNLTLKGSGTGKVYIDDDLEITGTTTFPSGLTVASGNITASSGNVSASSGTGTFGNLTVSGATYLATTSGNVGIGTTNPGYNLVIDNTGADPVLSFVGNSARLKRAAVDFLSYDGAYTVLSSANTIKLQTASGDRAVIDNSGNLNFNSGDVYFENSTGEVGIGTTAPDVILHIAGITPNLKLDSTSSEAQIVLKTSGDQWTIQADNVSGGLEFTGAASGQVFLQHATGNVGIGTTAPVYKLDVDGTLDATTITQAGTGVSLSGHAHAASDVTSGTLVHERGGLEADVSGYSGLVKIAGGTTSSVTVTTAGENLIDDSSAAVQRTTLGLVAGGAGDIWLEKAGDTMAGDIAMGTNKVTGLGVPTADADAATKLYVDQGIAGLKWKDSVKAATTANGTLATAFANAQTIDGITLVTGDRILIKNQTTGSENGIYTVNASGAPTRATDGDANTELVSAAVFIEQGTTNADTAWVCSNDAITLGTTALTFTQFSGAAVFSAGSGLTKSGSTFKLGGTLTEATTITQGNNKMLFDLTGTGDFSVDDALYVTDDGSVGIGTTAPSETLDIVGGKGIAIDASTTFTDPWTSATDYLRPIRLEDRWNMYYKYSGNTTLHFYDGAYGNFYRFGRGSADGFQKMIELGGNDTEHYLSLYDGTTDTVNTKISSDSSSYFNGGNIGIGTTAPTSLLYVYSNTTGSSGDARMITVENASTSSEAAIRFKSGDTSGNNWYAGLNQKDIFQIARGGEFTDAGTSLAITSAGDVGIGTADPASDLEIRTDNAGTVGAVLGLMNRTRTADTSNDVRFQFINSTDTADVTNAWIRGSHTGTGNQGELSFITRTVGDATGTRLFIKHDGSVGIGTTGPAHPLTLNAGANSKGFLLENSTGTDLAKLWQVGDDAGYLSLKDGTTTNVVISGNTGSVSYINSGKVGIGTTGPGAQLEVSGDGDFRISRSGHETMEFGLVGSNRFRIYNVNDAREDLVILDNGNVGIGTTGPAAPLDVVKSITDTSGTPLGSRISVTSAPGSASTANATGLQTTTTFTGTQNQTGIVGLYGSAVMEATAGTLTNAIGTDTLINFLSASGTHTVTNAIPLRARMWTSGTKYGTITNLKFIETGVGAAEGANLTITNAYGLYINSLVNGINKWGIYQAGTDDNYFAGKVGIGITNPTESLHIGSGGIKFPDGSTQTSAGAAGGWTDGGTDVYVTTTTDQVGIGTTAPSYKLDISDSASPSLRVIDTTNSRSMRLLADDNAGWLLGAGSHSINFRATGSGDPNMVITTAGNVGIGTTSPGSKLVVDGNIVIDSDGAVGDSGSVTFTGSRAFVGYDGSTTTAFLKGGSAKKIGLRVNGSNTDSLHIDTSGNVGIGTIAPAASLEVKNSGSGAGGFMLQLSKDASGTGENYMKLVGDTHEWDIGIGENTHGTVPDRFSIGRSGVAYDFIIDEAGRVGISATKPEAELDVSGTLKVGTAGDTGVAHDLIMTNTTASEINSYGPLTIQSGGSNDNFNLVLKGSGTGKVLVDDDFSATGNIELGDAVADTVKITGTVVGASPALLVNQTAADTIANFQDSGTSVMYLADGGNVGIGTTNPVALLEVAPAGSVKGIRIGADAAASGRLMEAFVGADERFYFDLNGNLNYSQAGWGTLNNVGGGGVQIEGALAVTDGGNVGIGTTAPGAKLDIDGGAGSANGLEISNLGTATKGIDLSNSGLSGSTDYYIYNSSSNYWRTDGILEIGNEITTGSSTSAADPDFSWTSDTDTGLYMPAVGTLGLTAGGTGTLFVTGGEVGIGTTAPSEKLDVVGNIELSGYVNPGDAHSRLWIPGQSIGNVQYFGTNGPTLTYLAKYNTGWKSTGGGRASALGIVEGKLVYANSASVGAADQALTWTDRFLIDTAGSVGIGTTGPGAPLHVYRGSGSSEIRIEGASAVDSYLKFYENTVERAYLRMEAGSEDLYTAVRNSGGSLTNRSKVARLGDITFYDSSGSENVIIKESGDVGIGITNPTSRFHGVDTMSAATGNEVAYNLAYTTNKATSGNDTGLLIAMTDTVSPGTSLPFDIQVGGGTKFSVDNAGNVVVAGNLTVNGTQVVLNVEEVLIEDNEMVLNANVTGAPTLDAQIRVERGTSADSYIKWNETSDAWEFFDGASTGTIGLSDKIIEGDSEVEVVDSGDGYIEFREDNADVMRITGGEVGIGTTDPQAELHVKDAGGLPILATRVDTNDGLYLDSGSTNSHYNWLVASQYNVNATLEITPSTATGGTTFSTPTAVFTQTGRVGIGTTAPGVQLDVAGDQIRLTKSTNDSFISSMTAGAGAWFKAEAATSENYFGLEMKQAGTGKWFLGSYGYPDFSITRGDKNGGSRLFTVLTNGNVGIGTTAPSRLLDISRASGSNGNPMVQINTNDNSPAAIQFVNSQNTGIIGVDDTAGDLLAGTLSGAFLINSTGNKALQLATNNAIAMTILGSGSVGISTAAPEAKLDVAGPLRVSTAGDVNVAHDLYFENTSAAGINSYGPLTITSGHSNANYNLVLKGTGTGKVYIDDDLEIATGKTFKMDNMYIDGNIGIGTTSPTAKLELTAGTQAGLKIGGFGTGDFKAIDMTSSGLSGVSDYFLYMDSANFWRADGAAYFGSTVHTAANFEGTRLNAIDANGLRLADDSNTLGVFIEDGGQVGIGTTSPGAKLQVDMASEGAVGLILRDSTDGEEYRIGEVNTNEMLISSNSYIDFRSYHNGPDMEIRNTDITMYQPLIMSNNLITNIGHADTDFTSGGGLNVAGNVGIGTTAPGQKLHVVSSGSYETIGIVGGRAYQVNSVDYGSFGANSKVGVLGSNYYSYKANLPTNPLGTQYATAGVVGIGAGTSGSAYGIGVAGFGQVVNSRTGLIAGGKFTANAGGDLNTYEDLYGVYATADGTANTVGGDNVRAIYGVATGQGTDKTYGGYFSGSGGGTNYGVYSAAGINYFAGNIGIGTTGPQRPLHIQADGSAYGIAIQGRASSDAGTFDFLANDGTTLQNRIQSETSGFLSFRVGSGNTRALEIQTDADVIINQGNVGIGTTAPVAKLQVSTGTSGDANVIIEADTDNNNENDQPSLEFRQDGALVNGFLGFFDGNNTFQLKTTGSVVDTAIMPTGNVGIGTTAPGAYKLNVSGAVNISGNLTVGGTVDGVTMQTVQTVDLTPEFPTAVLKGTGNGIMTSSFDTTASNFHNYYNWIGNAADQAYDIYVRVLVPEDFASWDATAAVTYYTNMDATPGLTGVTLTVYDTADASSYAGTKVQTAGWAANAVAGASLTGTYTDGDYMTLKFTMTADSSKNAKLGEVKLKYNRE